MKSTHRAWLTLATFAVLNILAGYSLAGRDGVLWCLVISLSINTLIYLYMETKVLNSLHGQTIEGQDSWGITNNLDKLVKKARVPKPKIIVINKSTPQAYIVSKNWLHSHIILTQGLLETFDDNDQRAILAYCVATIKRQDSFAQLIATAFTSFLLWITHFFDQLYRWLVGVKSNEPLFYNQPFTYLIAPLAQIILKLTLKKSDYISTDTLAASYLDSPKELAQALWKLESYRITMPLKTMAALAHGYIVNPLTSKGWTRYFQSHPSVKERIQSLIGYYPV